MTARNAGAVAGGAVLLIWPAIMNGYPLLFTDTGSYMEQLLIPFMIWDKPWIYGPVLVVLSLKLTLWLPVLTQGLLVSWILWRTQAVFRPSSTGWHLVLCLLLALGSPAPWFTSLLMPDVLASLTVLSLFVLAFDRNERWPVTAVATFSIAAHLTHLVVAAACLAVVLALRPRSFTKAAIPLAMAVILVMMTNLIGFGRISLSPYGSVFGLARLVADGPAKVWLEQTCPDPNYRMCDWNGRLPADSDEFLWDSKGPVWTSPGGPIGLAPEASRIVIETIKSQPWAVTRDAFGNWFTQLFMLRLDKVIAGKGLDETVGVRIHDHYPAAEEARFHASAQREDGLKAQWQDIWLSLFVLGVIGSSILLAVSRRRDPALFALVVLTGAGLFSNAFAAGVLSGPHDRYQARLAWLVLLPPVMFLMKYLDNRSRMPTDTAPPASPRKPPERSGRGSLGIRNR